MEFQITAFFKIISLRLKLTGNIVPQDEAVVITGFNIDININPEQLPCP